MTTNKVAKLVSDKKSKKRLNFFHDLKEELKKVSWTSKKELVLCTKVVIGTTLCFGLGIYAVDLLIRNGMDLLNYIVQIIAH